MYAIFDHIYGQISAPNFSILQTHLLIAQLTVANSNL